MMESTQAAYCGGPISWTFWSIVTYPAVARASLRIRCHIDELSYAMCLALASSKAVECIAACLLLPLLQQLTQTAADDSKCSRHLVPQLLLVAVVAAPARWFATQEDSGFGTQVLLSMMGST